MTHSYTTDEADYRRVLDVLQPGRRLTASYRLQHLLDEMLAAQSRFAVAWMDGKRLTRQQKRDEQIRDDCREQILALLAEVMVELEDGR